VDCEWIEKTLSKKSSTASSNDDSIEDVRQMIKRRKKASLWCSKSRSAHPLSSANKTSPKMPCIEFIDCYTKKYNNIPHDKFKNPLQEPHSVKRNNSIKINVNEVIQVKSYYEKSDSCDKQVEFENEKMMIPTSTLGDLSVIESLSPLESEARQIMSMLGISSEMLEKSINSGPKSEIIGIYRILMMRLKNQRENQHVTKSEMAENKMENSQGKVSPKKRKTLCIIL
jgi:hypothetical protein